MKLKKRSVGIHGGWCYGLFYPERKEGRREGRKEGRKGRDKRDEQGIIEVFTVVDIAMTAKTKDGRVHLRQGDATSTILSTQQSFGRRRKNGWIAFLTVSSRNLGQRYVMGY